MEPKEEMMAGTSGSGPISPKLHRIAKLARERPQPALSRFYRASEWVWCKWLNRRSHKAGRSWERFWRLKARYPLPPPRIVHSVYRLAANP